MLQTRKWELVEDGVGKGEKERGRKKEKESERERERERELEPVQADLLGRARTAWYSLFFGARNIGRADLRGRLYTSANLSGRLYCEPIGYRREVKREQENGDFLLFQAPRNRGEERWEGNVRSRGKWARLGKIVPDFWKKKRRSARN